MPPVLLCVPGLGLDRTAWHPTLQALGLPDDSVLTLPGYGVRARRGTDLSPPRLGALLAERLPAGGRVVLAGHSASCQVVAEAAVLVPDRVAGLVLVGPTTDPRAATWRALAGRWLATAVHEPPRQVPTLVRQYSRTGLRSMARAMDAARTHAIDGTLARTTCPVLVVRGPHDRICPDDWMRAVARTAPGGGATTALDAGAHMVPLTHGPLLARSLASFAPLAP